MFNLQWETFTVDGALEFHRGRPLAIQRTSTVNGALEFHRGCPLAVQRTFTVDGPTRNMTSIRGPHNLHGLHATSISMVKQARPCILQGWLTLGKIM
ncbi:uncharacterized protein LOC105423538 isoform X2 [Pogonomyrmex barbatus]|uniref:Uncharacterized protein LOC105423538 isoform X2 n=1 Tax=Pogonomyrmex barbatus TaxID=144034 RepID=A0A6I9VZZ0_9HYME|nr:uncharacterized protein LOC105423538 isoform X2 [Pogonomyrmex barbatus]